jgi:hypothetical protein
VKLLLAFCYNELALGVPTACQVWSAVALSQKKKKKVCASFNKSLKCKQIGRRKNPSTFVLECPNCRVENQTQTRKFLKFSQMQKFEKARRNSFTSSKNLRSLDAELRD